VTVPVSEDPRPACLCPGRAEGKHGLLCEHLLRGAFGSVGDAPEYVRQILRDKGRLVAGTVVTGEIEAADDLGSE
jgi:hypothetical protein